MIRKILFFILFVNVPIFCFDSNAFIETDLTKCDDYGHYCIDLDVNNRTYKFIVDIAAGGHVMNFPFHQSDPQLKRLHEESQNNQFHSLEPVNVELDNMMLKLHDVYLITDREFFREDFANGIGGIFHPQTIDAAYYILDFRNKKLFLISDFKKNIKSFLEDRYQQEFTVIKDYHLGEYDHVYIQGNVNNQGKAYFLLDSGGFNAVENEYAKASNITDTGSMTTLTKKIEVKYMQDVIFNIAGVDFYPNPDAIVTTDHNLLKSHEESTALDIKGYIGIETIEQMIIAMPCHSQSGAPIYFFKF